MSIEHNKELVRRYVEELVNLRDDDVGPEIFAPDFVYHAATGLSLVGGDAYLAALKAVLDAFPDWLATVEDIIAADDKVWDRVRVVATHSAQSTGGAPTGESLDESGVHIWRIANGKLVEAWFFCTPNFAQRLAYVSAVPILSLTDAGAAPSSG